MTATSGDGSADIIQEAAEHFPLAATYFAAEVDALDKCVLLLGRESPAGIDPKGPTFEVVVSVSGKYRLTVQSVASFRH